MRHPRTYNLWPTRHEREFAAIKGAAAVMARAIEVRAMFDDAGLDYPEPLARLLAPANHTSDDDGDTRPA